MSGLNSLSIYHLQRWPSLRVLDYDSTATVFLVKVVIPPACLGRVTYIKNPCSIVTFPNWEFQCMRGVGGRRVSLRLLTLASVNIGVYFVYVRAIEKAKQSGVEGTFHEAGRLQYDDIVRSSYGQFLGRSEQNSNTNHD